jgi:histidinol-phosphatase (PHP family)
MDMLANYHTHTYRCGHAYGEDEDYVLSAIKAGYQILGFSDHVMIPDIQQEDYRIRGDYRMLPDYLLSIRNLRDIYHNQIEIHIGMEAEYSPDLEDYLCSLLDTKQVEYLVFGNHYRSYKNHHFEDYFGNVRDPKDIIDYVTLAEKALSTGLYSCFAHPDLFMSNYLSWDSACEEAAHRICKASLQYQVPLELNQGGIRYAGLTRIGNELRYRYPYRRFWEIVAQYNNPVIIGVDAHHPNDFHHQAQKVTIKMANNLKLNLIFTLNFSNLYSMHHNL